MTFVLVVLVLAMECTHHRVICPHHIHTRHGVVHLGCTHFSSFIIVVLVFIRHIRRRHAGHIVCSYRVHPHHGTYLPRSRSFSSSHCSHPRIGTCVLATSSRHSLSSFSSSLFVLVLFILAMSPFSNMKTSWCAKNFSPALTNFENFPSRTVLICCLVYHLRRLCLCGICLLFRLSVFNYFFLLQQPISVW